MQMSVRKLCLRIVGLSFLLSWALLMWGQPITTELSRSPVGLGETFQIIYTLEGVTSHATPDFSPLQKDFHLLGTGKSFQVMGRQGNTKRITQWKVQVSAKHIGELVIPAIAFGDQTSEAVRLNVLDNQQLADQGQAPEVFMDVTVEAEHPYVQSQIIYSVRIYTAADVVNAQLSLPEANKGTFIPLGDDWRYTAQRYGQLYQVLERRYAMFPEASGDLMIYAPTFHGISVSSGPAFSDPFFDKIFAAPFQVQGPNTPLKILPVPAAYSAKQWLPAHQVQLQESWEKPKQGIRVGEPITRTITLQAEGVTVAQLPTLEVSEPDGVNVYPNKPIVQNKLSDGHILAEKIQNFVYIPSAAGDITLPEVQVAWWNVKTQQMEQTKLPATQWNVLPAVQTETVDQASPAEKSAPSKPITLDDVASEQAPTVTMATPAMPMNAWPWQLPWLVALGFALLWLLTILGGWLRYRRRGRPAKNNAIQGSGKKTILAALKRACQRNDSHAARQQLLAWANVQWSDQSFTTLHEVAIHSKHAGLSSAIDQLNQALYDEKTPDAWQGGTLWQAIEQVLAQASSSPKQTDELPPLYL